MFREGMDDTRVASHVAVVKVCTINILVSLHNPWVRVGGSGGRADARQRPTKAAGDEGIGGRRVAS